MRRCRCYRYWWKVNHLSKLAESALDELTPFFPELQTAWTEYEPLPGGEYFSLDGLIRGIQLRIKHIPIEIATRWASSYGTRVWQLLREVYTLEDFGIYFGHGSINLKSIT
jgi:glycerol-3-phosphate dehydrogenase